MVLVGIVVWGLGNLIIGQVSFILGVVVGLLVLLVVCNEKVVFAGLLVCVCSLFSLLVGFFLVLVVLAWVLEISWWWVGLLFLVGMGSVVSVVVGGGSGYFLIVKTSVIIVSVCVVFGMVCISRELHTLR